MQKYHKHSQEFVHAKKKIISHIEIFIMKAVKSLFTLTEETVNLIIMTIKVLIQGATNDSLGNKSGLLPFFVWSLS